MFHRVPYPFLFLAVLFSTGCASVSSLRIPPSAPPAWTFASPPPSYIRLPITLSVPKSKTVEAVVADWIHAAEKLPGDLLPGRGKFHMPSLPKLTSFWEAAQEPLYIDKGIWLLLRPEWISTGFARANPRNPFLMNLILEVKTHPTLVFGSKPSTPRKILPPIHLYKSGPEGFQAVGRTFISFKEANKILADPKTGLLGRVIPGSGSYRLRIRGIRLYGSGGRVIVQTRMTYHRPLSLDGKPVAMTLYFRGIPQYNPRKREFFMRRLDFDVKTGDFLTNVASWLFKSDLLKELRRKAKIPIGSKLEKLRKRMNHVLNRPVGSYSRLATRVDSFTFLDAYVDKAGIQAQLSLKGWAELKLLGK